MKKLSVLLVVVLLAGTLSACSNTPEVAFQDVVDAINARVIDELRATGLFDEDAFADDQIPGLLPFDLINDEGTDFVIEIDKALISNGYALEAMFNISADKIIVLKAKNKASVAAVKEALENTLEAQDNTWSWYLPDQYEKVKNNIIEVKGLYLLYVTYQSPERVAEAFGEVLK